MANRKALSISVTPAQARYIAARVRSGQYQSASELVRDALRTHQDQEKRRKSQIDDLRAKLAKGEAALREGRTVTPEQFRATLAAHRAASLRKRAS